MIKFLYLQNFVERHLTYQKPSWTPLGSINNFNLDGTIYSRYLRYSVDEGVNKKDILGFNQELLPVIQPIHPDWEIKQTRCDYSGSGSRLWGIVNVMLGPYRNEPKQQSKIDLDLYLPWWN